jgi:small neutral amino acid transporter SnatA (MarC family)
MENKDPDILIKEIWRNYTSAEKRSVILRAILIVGIFLIVAYIEGGNF